MESKLKIAQVLPTLKNLARSVTLAGLTTALFALTTQQANAEVIDRIDVNQVGSEAEIQLHFITRIQYKRQAALKNGDVRIYITLLDIKSDDTRLVWEKKESPPSDIVSPFTVTYPELDSSLTLSLGKVAKTRIRVGADGQTLSIFTKAIKAKKNTSSAVPNLPSVATLPVVAAAVVSATAAVTAADAAANAALPEPTAKVEGAGFATDLPPDATPQKTPEQIQQEAQKLFVTASDALQNSQVDPAVEALNKVLNLPPNVLTQAAQELMGEAREKNGEFAKAKVEYELYLKLYPNAADAKQVQARIANLPIADAKTAQAIAPTEAMKKGDDQKLKVTGGISQNYYRGYSNSDTFSVADNTTKKVSVTDQSRLVTSLDLMAQKRTETKDIRIVLREYNSFNFLPSQPEDRRWNAVYVEQSARDRKYMFRLGRQSGSSGGAPGRFDGIAGGYDVNPTWRLNVAAGKPVEYVTGGDQPDSKTFYSGSIDLTRLPDQWSGSAYGALQYVGGNYGKVGGIKERRALGLEAHYFEQQRSYMTQVEFDTIYRKVNLATFQGNWSQESGANYYLSLDHRRSPPLALNLSGQWTQSLKGLLGSVDNSGGVNSGHQITLQTLRDNAVALSQISNMLAVGMSRPVSSKLRLATDFRVSNTGSSGSSETMSFNSGTNVYALQTQSGSSGTGNSYSWSAQAIGNSLLFENDLGIANYSYSTNSLSKSHSLGFTQVETFKEKWRADASLQLSTNRVSGGSSTTQFRPSLTLNYRKNDKLSFSAESGIERYHSSDPTSDNKTLRTYFFLGYRWDFR
jgi:hypothetical protein